MNWIKATERTPPLPYEFILLKEVFKDGSFWTFPGTLRKDGVFEDYAGCEYKPAAIMWLDETAPDPEVEALRKENEKLKEVQDTIRMALQQLRRTTETLITDEKKEGGHE